MTKAQASVADSIHALSDGRREQRASSAKVLFALGVQRIQPVLNRIARDPEFQSFMVFHGSAASSSSGDRAKLTVGPCRFALHLRRRFVPPHGMPPLACRSPPTWTRRNSSCILRAASPSIF